MMIVRNCINSGNTPLGVKDGVDGLVSGDVVPLSWSDVSGTFDSFVSNRLIDGILDKQNFIKKSSCNTFFYFFIN